MFDNYRNRMERRYGKYMGESMRKQSDYITDATWLNSILARPVQVRVVEQGLPPNYESTDEFEAPLWAHFEENSKYNITRDEVDFFLTFRPHEIANHPEIRVGAYVAIPDEDDVISWWLIIKINDDAELKKVNILKTTRTFKWVAGGKIYESLGCGRSGASYNSGVFVQDRTDQVDNVYSVWLPTNSDSLTIGYDQRMIISDSRRNPPLVWTITRIEDQVPTGVTKFKFTQTSFNPERDNVELGLADYYGSEFAPEPVSQLPAKQSLDIVYSGTKPTIKIGGNYKTFTALLPDDNHFGIKWSLISDEEVFGDTYEDFDLDLDDYKIVSEGRQFKVKVAKNYNLIGRILTIEAQCADGTKGVIEIEVIG